MWFSARKTRRDARATCIVRRHLARPRLDQLEDRTLLAAPWPFSIGGSNTDKGQDIATVPAGLPDAGSVYVSGFFGSKTDFDPSTTGTASLSPTSSNLVDQFLAKYDSTGNFLWARHISGTGAGGHQASVAVGSDGSVYFAGWFTGTGGITGVESTTTTTRVEHPIPGGNNLVSSRSTQGKATYYQDGLVARFDTNGGLTWVKLFGGVGAMTQPNDLAVGVSGMVYVTGEFTGTVDFDPGTGVASRASAGGDDIFAARLNADGTFGWASTAGAAGRDLGYSIAAAADGGAYIVGQFEAMVSFGGAVLTLSSIGSSDAVVARLAPNGTFAWARRMGGTGMERGRGVAAFRDGTVDTVYVAGDFVSPTASFADPTNPGDTGTQSLTHSGGSTYLNGFVSKLVDTGVAGNFVWTDALSPPTGTTTGGLAVYNLTVDALGGVYTTGQFSSTTIDFDPGPATAPLTATANDVYVSKFNADGSYAWARRMSATTGGPWGQGIAWDATSGAVFVTGNFAGSLDTGTGILRVSGSSSKLGNTDIFVVKLDQPIPLLTSAAAPAPVHQTLTPAQARPVLAQALALWRVRGADTSRLGRIDIAIADLGGDRLGEAAGSTITLDDNAAGWGWDVGRPAGRGREALSGRMDLLSVLTHEVGHLLGRDHAEGGVMAETLAPGVRLAAADPGLVAAPESGPDHPLAALPPTSSRLSLRALWGRGRRARAAARG